MLITVLAVSFLIVLLNALYVAAEFAVIALRRPALEKDAAAGDHQAARLLRIVSSPDRQDRYVAASQLGITIASLGLGMYGEHSLTHIFEGWIENWGFAGRAAVATTLSLSLLTTLHIVVGEMLPKGVALQNPRLVAKAVHWPMQMTLVLLYPLIALSNWLSRLCLRLLGIRRETNVHELVYTPEELQFIVEESERGGALRSESGHIVRELLEFGDRTAGQAMVPRVRVIGLPVGATPDQIRATVLQHRRTRYPVYEDDLDHIVGMLHAKDLLRRLIANEPVSAADVRRIPVVPETASLDHTLATMQRAQAHMAIVIDEHGGTAGIINLEDLFEEVVGEIDEDAPAEPALRALADGRVRAVGTLWLDELGRELRLDLEHEEVDSVSGLVLALLGRTPAVGDVVDYGRLRLEVTQISGRGVKEVIASVQEEA